ncbi:hypothetical protein SAMN02745975_01711 [Geosporobacter subterraneus DSM 17957]|uniref:Lipoprotein n=1 Tax=Geosporobacter subterraneus DSM 17957 TaxID=1121919 RepID=A0A1M6I1F7_9FIRM|nr:hypothetical protein [Geosporobacter subterraneus]SHJ28293.1 hypothetical protein SAMN02745975_01711 [Geosporobacter subterraneus DSM 17957]
MSYNRNIFMRIMSFLLLMMLCVSAIGCSRQKEALPQEEVVASPLQKEFSAAFTGEKDRKRIDVPFEPLKFTAQVKPYQVKADLSNIVNLQQFGEFTPEQRKLIAKNGFVVLPTKEEQLFYIYEKQ